MTDDDRKAIWTTLCQTFGFPYPPRGKLGSRLGALVRELVEYEATADEIRKRYRVMKGHGWKPLTPEALVKHWYQLTPKRDEGEYARQQTREYLERLRLESNLKLRGDTA